MPKIDKTISEVLKSAIHNSDKTAYQIAKEAGVTQAMIGRFLSGERDIRLATADKLASVLSLKLREEK